MKRITSRDVFDAAIFIAALTFALLLLVSCAAFEPKVEWVPYQVKVPIAVPCSATVPPEPDWATKAMPHVDPATGEGLDVAVDKLVIEREQRMGYEEKLKAATDGCRP